MKAKVLAILGFFIIPPITVFPLLSYQDTGLKVITIEGSGSLFEPIQHLIRGNKVNAEISVLPTGSSGGKEALTDNSSSLALTSLSDKSTLSSSQSQAKEVSLATDPIVLVYKKGNKCQLFNKDTNGQQNKHSDLLNKLFNGSHDCESLTLFLREGYYDRSNLNKTVMSSGSSLGSESKNRIEEVPENNFLALHKFSLESDLYSVIFFPKSFYELNKESFSAFGYEILELKSEGSGQSGSLKLQKELSLLFKPTNIDKEPNLKPLITDILGQKQQLEKEFKLRPCDTKAEEILKNLDTFKPN